MACVEDLPYEVVLSRASFAECREYVEKHCTRYCLIEPGLRLFDSYLFGVDGDVVVFPNTKPCCGTLLLRIEGAGTGPLNSSRYESIGS